MMEHSGGVIWKSGNCGKSLMSEDELAVMDGGKCILQVRGVRPFLSDSTTSPSTRTTNTLPILILRMFLILRNTENDSGWSWRLMKSLTVTGWTWPTRKNNRIKGGYIYGIFYAGDYDIENACNSTWRRACRLGVINLLEGWQSWHKIAGYQACYVVFQTLRDVSASF